MNASPSSAFSESTLLSNFVHSGGQAVRAAHKAPSMFDACHVGVVLRAVLFVQAVVAVAALFAGHSWTDIWTRFALITGSALPATLAWLIAICALKKPLLQLPLKLQVVAGALLGSAAGLYGCALLFFLGLWPAAQWLASAAAGALLSAIVLAGLIWRAKARTPAAIAAHLDELQARIRPHFLFNTLNSAIALIRAEPLKAEQVLEDLSELFRHALADPAESVTLGQEIALAKRYLAIEQIRFGPRLRMQWHLDPKADLAKLPPLLLQPLVENAVRHGVEPSSRGSQLHLSTQLRGSRVIVKLSNEVPAGSGEPGHGLALANVRERLLLMHDVQARFQTVLKDKVFYVRLEIPA